jgi:hypothetical protein
VSASQARVARTLDLLTAGLGPVVQQAMAAEFGDGWVDVARQAFRNERMATVMARLEPSEWDAQALLTVMWDQWNAVFRHRLGLLERSLVSELRELRNRWAHQAEFSDDDLYRLIDSTFRLLRAVSASDLILRQLAGLKLDVLRDMFSRQIEEERARANARRDRLTEVALFVVSCFAVVVATLVSLAPRNPLAGMLLVAFTLLTFGYLIVQRLRRPVMTHGVHECPVCRKIIYTEVCPYCEAVPPPKFLLAKSKEPVPEQAESRQSA